MLSHEVGHLLAAHMVGIKIKSVGLDWKGLYTVREAGPPAKNMAVSLAGPVANLILFACAPRSSNFALANLCFLFVNLLPLEGSDGMRIWQCWRQIGRERQRAAAAQTLRRHTAPWVSRTPAFAYGRVMSKSNPAGGR
jgi:Zn-dependent protease